MKKVYLINKQFNFIMKKLLIRQLFATESIMDHMFPKNTSKVNMSVTGANYT